jgi:hypothetical protein
MKNALLPLLLALGLGGCASGPQDVMLVASVRLPYALSDFRAGEIFDAARPLDHRYVPPNSLVCTSSLLPSEAITRRVGGGLFDVRETDRIDSGTLQAALQPAGGACPPDIRPLKLEAVLNPGLALQTPTGAGVARVLIGNDVLTTDGGFFRFTLEHLDVSQSRARSRGVFKLMTSLPGETSLLYMEGSFNLRDFEFNGAFLP